MFNVSTVLASIRLLSHISAIYFSDDIIAKFLYVITSEKRRACI